MLGKRWIGMGWRVTGDVPGTTHDTHMRCLSRCQASSANDVCAKGKDRLTSAGLQPLNDLAPFI
eukprot:9875-Eustigmatos_ZCMA.PRE.1